MKLMPHSAKVMALASNANGKLLFGLKNTLYASVGKLGPESSSTARFSIVVAQLLHVNDKCVRIRPYASNTRALVTRSWS